MMVCIVLGFNGLYNKTLARGKDKTSYKTGEIVLEK